MSKVFTLFFIHASLIRNIDKTTFVNFVEYARIYFEESATKEILEELRVMICPFDSAMNTAFERFELFLPTIFGDADKNAPAFSHQLWLGEFLNIWTTLSAKHFWESHAIRLFARVAADTIGEFDWSPHIPFIFNNVLRGFGLPLSSKDIAGASSSAIINSFSQMVVYSSEDVTAMAGWIVSMIGTGANRHACLLHLDKLCKALRSFYYPSNTGSWTVSETPSFLFCYA